MFETIKGIIGDIAAGAMKDQRILLSQEQLITLDLKLRLTATHSRPGVIECLSPTQLAESLSFTEP
jgi:hypothetical protein